jgi:hypothetical protein
LMIIIYHPRYETHCEKINTDKKTYKGKIHSQT